MSAVDTHHHDTKGTTMTSTMLLHEALTRDRTPTREQRQRAELARLRAARRRRRTTGTARRLLFRAASAR